MKLLAILILLSAALVAAWAALIRVEQHPLLIDASAKAEPPCLLYVPPTPNPLKPTRKADA